MNGHTLRHSIMSLFAVFFVGVVGTAEARAQEPAAAGVVASQPYRTIYYGLSDSDFLNASVDLQSCVETDGETRPLVPETDDIKGFAVFLHSGHPFSIRTLFWSATNEAIDNLPEADRSTFTIEQIEVGARPARILSQVVVKLRIGEKLVPLILDHDESKKASSPYTYRPACDADYPVARLPDHYPTLDIKPLDEPIDGAAPTPLETALGKLRKAGGAGQPLPFFSTGASALSQDVGMAVRPFPFRADGGGYRTDIAYEDFLEAVDLSNEAAFLETLGLSAELKLLGTGRAIQRQFEITRRAMDWRMGAGQAASPAVTAPDSVTARWQEQLKQKNERIAELEGQVKRLEQQPVDGSAGGQQGGGGGQQTGAGQDTQPAIQTQLDEANRRIDALEAELSDAQSKIEGLESEGGADPGTGSGDQTEIDRLKSDLSFAEAEVTAAESELKQEKDKVARLQTQVEALQASVKQFRLALPAVFSGRDMSDYIELAAGGACADGEISQVEGDPLSYTVVGCTDVDTKDIRITGFQPIERGGLTAELRLDELVPDGTVVTAGINWRPYFPTRDSVATLTLPPRSLAEFVTPSRHALGFAFPVGLTSAPPDSAMAKACRGTIPVSLDDLLNGRVQVAPDAAPPCAAARIDFPQAWFSTAGAGIDGCLAGYSADVPLCARPWENRFEPVTITAGAGWAPVSLARARPQAGEADVPLDISWAALARRLRPVWPFADTNPVDPTLPERPVYTVSAVKYDRDAVSCTNSRAAEQVAPEDLLLPLGATGVKCVGGGFSLDRLPESMTVTFKQPADTENLVYRPRVTKTFKIDADLNERSAPSLSGDDLLGAYPVWLTDASPVAGGSDFVYFHPDLASCEGSLNQGAATTVYYSRSRPLQQVTLGTTIAGDALVRPAAVIFSGNQQVTHCTEGVPRRRPVPDDTATNAGQETAVYMTFQSELRRLPGGRSVVLLVASETLQRNGVGDAIKEALRAWLVERVTADKSPVPFTIMTAQPGGAVQVVLEGEDLVKRTLTKPEDIIDQVIAPKVRDIRFAGTGSQDLSYVSQSSSRVWETQAGFSKGNARPLSGDGSVIKSFVFIGDLEGEQITPETLAPLAVLRSLYGAEIGVASRLSCAEDWWFDGSSTGDNALLSRCVDLPVQIDAAGTLVEQLKPLLSLSE